MHVHTFNVEARAVTASAASQNKLLFTDPKYKAEHKYVLKNLQLQTESAAATRAYVGGVSFSLPLGGSIEPGAEGGMMTSISRWGAEGPTLLA
ncbi:hypothetical protein ACFSTC_37955 [Nonomuraea ferruginea]